MYTSFDPLLLTSSSSSFTFWTASTGHLVPCSSTNVLAQLIAKQSENQKEIKNIGKDYFLKNESNALLESRFRQFFISGI